jgi:hypothetical protein
MAVELKYMEMVPVTDREPIGVELGKRLDKHIV